MREKCKKVAIRLFMTRYSSKDDEINFSLSKNIGNEMLSNIFLEILDD